MTVHVRDKDLEGDRGRKVGTRQISNIYCSVCAQSFGTCVPVVNASRPHIRD